MKQVKRSEKLLEIIKDHIAIFPLAIRAPKELLNRARKLYNSEICDDAIISRLNNIYTRYTTNRARSLGQAFCDRAGIHLKVSVLKSPFRS